jgi:hypothetical protein
MDRALRSIAKLRRELVPASEVARVAWKAAVGDKIDARTRFIDLVRDRAVIEVEDRVWQAQLNTLERQIIGRLEKYLGKGVVKQLEFRIAIPRRAPQTDTQPEHSPEFALLAQHPEAARIADPGLRRVYLRSKKRATA